MSSPSSIPQYQALRLTRQPFKLLYTTLTLITLPLRIFAILLYYIPKSTRQHPKWTYHQAVGMSNFSICWHYTTIVEFHTTKSLQPGSERDRFVVIDPPSTSISFYRGIIGSNPAIQPITIGGVWFTSPPPSGQTPKMVVIHFHGGAYVLGGARQMESGWGPEVLSKRMEYPVLQVQHRLAIEPNSCFPAAVQDGITAYNYVLKTLGVKPENVVLSGESAGGNLVLAMLRYLSTDCKGILPLPRAGLCWSPWLDMTIDTKALDKHPSITTDYVFGSLIEWGKRCYIPKDLSPGHPYLSPLGNELDCPVSIFVQTGMAEVLYEDHVLFAERMKE
ncbi:alpha beta hydrolase fold-3 domain containing protein [Rutstroemia sp. NJR-2017a BBW]|nr:alpha beta hydrolase fold-3 domain containing protein [Rutstroemia sp. NJR-2017a BBW]